MIGTGIDDLHDWLGQPRADVPRPLGYTHGFLEDARIGTDPHESEHYRCRQADRFGSRQTPLPPCDSLAMERRIGIVGVEQQVDVGDDQAFFLRRAFSRKASTSRSSASLFKLVGSIPVLRPMGRALTRNGIFLARRVFPTRPARRAALSVSLN